MFSADYMAKKGNGHLTKVRNHTILYTFCIQEGVTMGKNYYDKVHRVNNLSNELVALYHKVSAKLGVADSVMLVLYTAYNNGGKCLLRDIYYESGTCKQTINSAIRKLERENIIYLERLNGKTKRVCLTEQGIIYAAKTAARMLELESNAFDGWEESEIEQYLSLTGKYVAAFAEQVAKL